MTTRAESLLKTHIFEIRKIAAVLREKSGKFYINRSKELDVRADNAEAEIILCQRELI
jgi:hypothetical protein